MCIACGPLGQIFAPTAGATRRSFLGGAARLAIGAGAAGLAMSAFRAEAVAASNPSGKADAVYFGGDILTMEGDAPATPRRSPSGKAAYLWSDRRPTR